MFWVSTAVLGLSGVEGQDTSDTIISSGPLEFADWTSIADSSTAMIGKLTRVGFFILLCKSQNETDVKLSFIFRKKCLPFNNNVFKSSAKTLRNRNYAVRLQALAAILANRKLLFAMPETLDSEML